MQAAQQPLSWSLKDNAAAALTIRHSLFAALTLAKLIASLALHPPSSATGSGGLCASPRLRRSLSSRRIPFGSYAFQHTHTAAFPLIRLATRSTPSPVWEKALIVVRLASSKNVSCISTANGSLPLGGEGAERSEADEV